MKTSSILRFIANGTAWSFLGVLLTVLFFYLKEYHNPFDFRIIINNEVNLVEIKERIEDLKIYYKNEDLLKSKREIKILTLTIINKGQTILQQFYDQQQSFGLKLTNSIVLSTEIIDFNSDYLKNNIFRNNASNSPKIEHSNNQTLNEISQIPAYSILNLSKVIFEKGKYLTLKLYLLQPSSIQKTNVTAVGKIANIDEITVSPYESEIATPRLSEFKFLLNFMILYICLVIVLIILTRVLDKIEGKKKDRKMKNFITNNPNLNDEQKRILEIYRYEWNSRLARLVRSIGRGHDTLDLKKYIEQNFRQPKFHIFRLLYPHRLFLWLDVILPKEIFQRDKLIVNFNTKNRDFIIKFFREMGVLTSPQKI